MTPGVYDNLPIAQYHASEGYSKSQLWYLHTRSAYAFYKEYMVDKPEPNPTKWGETNRAIALGGAVAALEHGENVFDAGYYVLDTEISKTNKNSNQFKQGFASAVERLPDKTVILQQECSQALAIVEAISHHPDPWTRDQLQAFFSSPDMVSERSYYHQDSETGLLIKARPDHSLGTALLGDTKTTTDCGEWAFGKRILDQGHHVQAAMAIDVVNHVQHCNIDQWLLIVVEQSEPHDVACYYLDTPTLELGRKTYRESLLKLKHCLDTDTWPGKVCGITPISVPTYALNNHESF